MFRYSCLELILPSNLLFDNQLLRERIQILISLHSTYFLVNVSNNFTKSIHSKQPNFVIIEPDPF